MTRFYFVFLLLSQISLGKEVLIHVFYMELEHLIPTHVMLNSTQKLVVRAQFKKNSYFINDENFKYIIKSIKKKVPYCKYAIIIGTTDKSSSFSNFYNIYSETAPKSHPSITQLRDIDNIELVAYPSAAEQIQKIFSKTQTIEISEQKYERIILSNINDFCKENTCDEDFVTSGFNQIKIKEIKKKAFDILFNLENLKNVIDLSKELIVYYKALNEVFSIRKELSAEQLLPLLTLSLLSLKNETIIQKGFYLSQIFEKGIDLSSYCSSREIWALTQLSASSVYITSIL